MIWWLITVFLDAMNEIMWQKAVQTAKNMAKTLYNAFRFVGGILIVIFLLAFGIYDYHELLNIDIYLYIIMIFITIIWLFTSSLRQIVYKKEKLSAILPYQKINSLLIIIVSFFWFKDTSWTSFIITIFLLFLLAFSTIDFKKHQQANNKALILFIESLVTIQQLLVVYIIKLVTDKFYFLSYNIIGFIFTIVIALIFCWKSIPLQLKNQSISFYKYRASATILWWISTLISAFLIKSYGAVITLLLWFLCVGVMLLLSYFIQKDRPAKKDIILAVVVTVLVWAAYMLK